MVLTFFLRGSTWTNYEARRPWYRSLKVCSSHSRVISFKCSHILTPRPRLSQLYILPNPGLQDWQARSSFCLLSDLTSVTHTWTPCSHHIGFLFNSWNMSTSFTAPRILQVLFLCLNMCLYIHMYSCTFFMADSSLESQFQEEELQSMLPWVHLPSLLSTSLGLHPWASVSPYPHL